MKNFIMIAAFIAASLVLGKMIILIEEAFASASKEKMYTIEAGHAVYHTDSFRMYGKGIVFSTEDQEVILMGDFQILKQKQP